LMTTDLPSGLAEVYAEAEHDLGPRLAFGASPVVVAVDLMRGFLDPACPLGTPSKLLIDNINLLLDTAHATGVRVIFTVIEYQAGLADAGLWAEKVPGLRHLVAGTGWTELDPRVRRMPQDIVITKKAASAVFVTQLGALLRRFRADTVVLCGVTTSGCVRATAVDLLQLGYPAMIPRQCVGDRDERPHNASLFDLQTKYAEVVDLSTAGSYLKDRPTRPAEYRGV
jgi:maleamate amidohydrolase